MKFSQFLLLSLACLGTLSAQPTAPVAVSGSNTQADFVALNELAGIRPPTPAQEMGPEKYFTWVDEQNQKITTAALAFYEAHPTDARRWDAVLLLTNKTPLFVKGFGPGLESKGIAAVIVDEPAKAKWMQKADALKQALLTSTDATPEVREPLEWGMFAKDFRAGTAAMRAGKPVDWAAFRPRFDAHVAKYQSLNIGVTRAGDYLGALERNVPGSSAAEWTHLAATTPDPALRTLADQRLKLADLMSHPLELAFTAADGRAVDLKSLRGKVVLVDFWATWCGPCKEELPNVVANYKKYHDQGFEVVGVALENGKLTSKDTLEQTTVKLETAKKILSEFTTQHDMPWPQYFDGKFWKTSVAVNFNIQAIPAMFLLDQDGKVVSTNARGPKLETEVKRLLNL